LNKLLLSLTFLFCITLVSAQTTGCTDSTALNYDPLANTDDGSCYYLPAPDFQCVFSDGSGDVTLFWNHNFLADSSTVYHVFVSDNILAPFTLVADVYYPDDSVILDSAIIPFGALFYYLTNEQLYSAPSGSSDTLSAISFSISHTNVNCWDDTDGRIAINMISNMLTPFTYSLDGVPNPNAYPLDSVWENLPTGIYDVTISDNANCIITTPISITAPGLPLQALVSGNMNICFGSNLDFAVGSALGGTPGYSYEWFDSGFYSFSANDTAFGLSAGSYYLEVTDANGCDTFTTVNVMAPQTALGGSPQIFGVQCKGDATGMLVGDATGSWAPYRYEWFDMNGVLLQSTPTGSPVSERDTLFDLSAGSYILKIFDAQGCEVEYVLNVPEPNVALSIDSMILIEGNACYGDSVGRAMLTVSGGQQSYSYAWDNGETTLVAEELTFGWHSVLLTDDWGCKILDSVFVTENSLIVSDLVVDNTVSCYGFSDGQASISTVGGSSFLYTYYWSTSQTTLNANVDVASGLSYGSYYVTTRDDLGCEVVDSVYISEPEPLIIDSLVVTNSSCFGINDAQIEILASGGQSPYSYSNTGGLYTQINPVFSNLSPGYYTIWAIDANGCYADSIITLTYPDQLVIDSTIFTHISCFGEDDGAVQDIIFTGGTAPFEYSINGVTSQSYPLFNDLEPGWHTVEVIDINNGVNGIACATSALIIIEEPDPLLYTTYNVIDESILGACDGQIWVNVTGGTGNYYYDVSEVGNFPIVSANQVQLINDSLIYNLCAGSHSIYITDDNNCEGTVFWGGTWVENIAPGLITLGCTDSLALNYDPAATVDDSSCIASVLGCTDSLALNFDSLANTDDGSCCGDYSMLPFGFQIGQDIDGETARDYVGYSVSLSDDGNIIAVGYPGSYSNNSCYVRIFENSGGSWVQLGQDISGEVIDDEFGHSVSLSSDGYTVAIGAPENGPSRGHVRIYNFNGSSWNQLGQDIDGEENGDESGNSVSISDDGNTVAIGARYSDGDCNNCNGYDYGHVRIYNWNGNSWNQLGQDLDGENPYDMFGYSVSLSSDGNTVAIGGPNNPGNNGSSWSDAGHVRIYNYNGSSWYQLGDDIDGFSANYRMGYSVSLSSDGNTVAIGAAGADKVYIYSYNGSSWVQLGQELNGEAYMDGSGESVSLSADGITVAIGAIGNDGNGTLAGHVRIYSFNGSSWVQLGNDIDGEAAYDQIGHSVSLSSDGNTIAIGAPDIGGDADIGYVSVFSLGGMGYTSTACSGCTDSLALNYDPYSLIDDGSCIIYGCTDIAAFNYNPTATIDDSSCIATIFGCIDSTQFNYNVLANTDDGSCIPFIYGCTDSTACNYDASANTDDSSCLTDYGCTDPTAFNYDALATCDDGSCIPFIYGCTDVNADNYSSSANTDDGSCLFCNINTTVTIMNETQTGACDGFVFANSTSSYPPVNYYWLDINGTAIAFGTNSVSNLCSGTYYLYSYDINCVSIDTFIIENLYGCTDPTASNYDPYSLTDNGTCIYLGCTDSLAFNYDTMANTDDGSCQYCDLSISLITMQESSPFSCDAWVYVNASSSNSPITYYWSTGSTANNIVGICSGTYTLSVTDAVGCIIDTTIIIGTPAIYGCTDPTADNYDAAATTDDGSCTYSTVCNEDPPTGLFVDGIIHSRAVINWDNMNSAACTVDQYRIRFREVSTSSWTQKTMGGPVGSCTWGNQRVDKLLLGLTANTTYEYEMKAWYCGGGASSWTGLSTFTTADDCPNVGNLTAYGANPTKATFDWDASNGVYEFVRLKSRVDSISNASGSDWFQIGGSGVAYGTYTKNKNGLVPGETYRAQARAFCDPNGGAYFSLSWTPLVYWTQPVVRVEGGTAIANLAIYPNPSRDVFNISFTSETVQDLRIRILNVIGEELMTDDLQQFIGEYTKQITLHENAKGIYFLEIETNEGVVNKKLILQ